MKAFSILVLSVIILSVNCSNKQEESADLVSRVEPTTTTLLVSALVPVLMNSLSGLFSHLTKPADYQDVYKKPKSKLNTQNNLNKLFV